MVSVLIWIRTLSRLERWRILFGSQQSGTFGGIDWEEGIPSDISEIMDRLHVHNLYECDLLKSQGNTAIYSISLELDLYHRGVQ